MARERVSVVGAYGITFNNTFEDDILVRVDVPLGLRNEDDVSIQVNDRQIVEKYLEEKGLVYKQYSGAYEHGYTIIQNGHERLI